MDLIEELNNSDKNRKNEFADKIKNIKNIEDIIVSLSQNNGIEIDDLKEILDVFYDKDFIKVNLEALIQELECDDFGDFFGGNKKTTIINKLKEIENKIKEDTNDLFSSNFWRKLPNVPSTSRPFIKSEYTTGKEIFHSAPSTPRKSEPTASKNNEGEIILNNYIGDDELKEKIVSLFTLLVGNHEPFDEDQENEFKNALIKLSTFDTKIIEIYLKTKFEDRSLSDLIIQSFEFLDKETIEKIFNNQGCIYFLETINSLNLCNNIAENKNLDDNVKKNIIANLYVDHSSNFEIEELKRFSEIFTDDNYLKKLKATRNAFELLERIHANNGNATDVDKTSFENHIKNIDLNVTDIYGYTLLGEISYALSDKDIVGFAELLLENISDEEKQEYFNKYDKPGNTILTLACQNGYVEFVNFLLGKGANPNIPNKYGNSPLLTAVFYNHIGIMVILLKNEATIDFETPQNTEGFFNIIFDPNNGVEPETIKTLFDDLLSKKDLIEKIQNTGFKFDKYIRNLNENLSEDNIEKLIENGLLSNKTLKDLNGDDNIEPEDRGKTEEPENQENPNNDNPFIHEEDAIKIYKNLAKKEGGAPKIDEEEEDEVLPVEQPEIPEGNAEQPENQEDNAERHEDQETDAEQPEEKGFSTANASRPTVATTTNETDIKHSSDSSSSHSNDDLDKDSTDSITVSSNDSIKPITPKDDASSSVSSTVHSKKSSNKGKPKGSGSSTDHSESSKAQLDDEDKPTTPKDDAVHSETRENQSKTQENGAANSDKSQHESNKNQEFKGIPRSNSAPLLKKIGSPSSPLSVTKLRNTGEPRSPADVPETTHINQESRTTGNGTKAYQSILNAYSSIELARNNNNIKTVHNNKMKINDIIQKYIEERVTVNGEYNNDEAIKIILGWIKENKITFEGSEEGIDLTFFLAYLLTYIIGKKLENREKKNIIIGDDGDITADNMRHLLELAVSRNEIRTAFKLTEYLDLHSITNDKLKETVKKVKFMYNTIGREEIINNLRTEGLNENMPTYGKTYALFLNKRAKNLNLNKVSLGKACERLESIKSSLNSLYSEAIEQANKCFEDINYHSKTM